VRKLIVAFCFFLASGCFAAEAEPLIDDPLVEARFQALAEELRCLVCQNQNLADSHAGLAIDLKTQLREMIVAGRSDREIIDYMVQRYGDFVLYRPPLKATTWLLWGGPFVLFVGALGFLLLKLRRRSSQAPDPLSPAQRAAAARLLVNQKEEGV